MPGTFPTLSAYSVTIRCRTSSHPLDENPRWSKYVLSSSGAAPSAIREFAMKRMLPPVRL